MESSCILHPMRLRSYLSLFGLVLLLGYRPAGPHTLTIRFAHFVGDLPLQLAVYSYTNSFKETFTIEQFKYYISDIRITGDDAVEESVLKGAHLVDAADSSTMTIQINTTLQKLSTIRFKIGVDSQTNTSGIQSGDLDPMLGMFWTWNTGYIYARLEGQGDSVHAPAHRFTWDVGGYRANVNAVREIALQIPTPKKPITIQANLLHWFDGRHQVRLSRSPICHQPGDLAMQLADNYSTMFSIAL